MFWEIFGTIVFVCAIAGVAYIYIQDRRYEKKSVKESMSDSLWDEIAAEREAALLRAKKFRQALDSAKKK